MKEEIQNAISSLEAKMNGNDVEGSIKFEIEDVGSIVIIDGEVKQSEEDTDCTLQGTLDTFTDIFNGDISSTTAFMGGKLKIEGSMGVAMQYNAILS